ncbi:MAG: hypothetical protein Q8K48_05535 [Candidatus Planktophila sp.]|nr:hypothetical protein [Candidatus Planktophila sp.]
MELESSYFQVTVALLGEGLERGFWSTTPLFQINLPPYFIQVYLTPFELEVLPIF